MFTRILLAIDGTESREVAASFVMPLATQFAAAVRIVYVNEFMVGGRGFKVSTEREATRIVDDTVGALRLAGIDTDGAVLIGNCFNVDQRIVDAATAWSADVIVLGSHRRRWLRRFSGTGMRERVTSLTSLPTLTAPAPLKVASRFRHTSPSDQKTPILEVPTISK